ncbi:hypothetical protein ECANGB1_513 [Enterospora canceri]|uniref:Uncharacterized protein n=1 Tax=Enterospora canceri TaxID=1081671 RepID=A0A1Y1S504_9MICR|nr:hypothetical protein ECANGB1_513 [Enterospora canceri]
MLLMFIIETLCAVGGCEYEKDVMNELKQLRESTHKNFEGIKSKIADYKKDLKIEREDDSKLPIKQQEEIIKQGYPEFINSDLTGDFKKLHDSLSDYRFALVIQSPTQSSIQEMCADQYHSLQKTSLEKMMVVQKKFLEMKKVHLKHRSFYLKVANWIDSRKKQQSDAFSCPETQAKLKGEMDTIISEIRDKKESLDNTKTKLKEYETAIANLLIVKKNVHGDLQSEMHYEGEATD